MDNCYAALRVAVCTALLCCRTTQPARAEHAALLTPTGSYSVGRTFFYWTDPNRTDPVAARRGTKREFMVIAWYPAEANTSDVHALWIPESWALSEAKLLYAERSNRRKPKGLLGLRRVTDRPATLFVRQAMRVLVSEGEQSLRGARSGNSETVLGPIEQEVDGEPRLNGHKRQTEALRSSHAADILASNRKRRN